MFSLALRGTRSAFILTVALVVAPLACSDDTTTTVDQGPAPDAARVDGALFDSLGGPERVVPDASPDQGVADGAVDQAIADLTAGEGVASSLPKTCTGACAKQTLTVTFGSVSVPIERAIYGIDRDAKGNPGVYIEALHGGFSGCPTQSSPTTDRTLILSGLPLPVDAKAITRADGLVVSLFDYKGDLLTSKPMTKATAASVTFVAADVCPSCVGKPAPSHPAGFVALDLDATFGEGTIKGRLYAVHCDSLDL